MRVACVLCAAVVGGGGAERLVIFKVGQTVTGKDRFAFGLELPYLILNVVLVISKFLLRV